MQEKAENEERMRNIRHLQSTNRAEFNEKDLTTNTVGRKVMRTQDGKVVTMAERDDQLIVESGMFRRTQKDSDEVLKARAPQGDYDKTVPVTIYTENLQRK